MKASVVALSLLGLPTALCFSQPSPSLFRRHWTTSTVRGRTSRTTLKALPPIDDISNVALAIVENSNVQDFRQFAQTATESFLKSLVVRTALGMLGSYILGQIISAGKGAFFKGKERIDSGDLDLSSLYLCIFLDLIGDSSYLLPGLGETEDLIWAPISALVLSAALGSTQVGAIDLVKEALPFTDALPVATLAWALKNVYPESGLTKLLGLSPNEKKETTGRK